MDNNYNPITKGMKLNTLPVFDAVVGFSPSELSGVYYSLSATNEKESQLLEGSSLSIIEDVFLDGEEVVLDAVKSTFQRVPRTLMALNRVLNKFLSAGDIEASPPEIGKVKKSGIYASFVAKIMLSDGQSISIVFHAPDGDPKRIDKDDIVIAFRWMLNSSDITSAVAPEIGNTGFSRDISLSQVVKRVSQLIIKNSEKFVARQANIAKSKEELVEQTEALENLSDKEASLIESLGTISNSTTESEESLESAQDRLKRISSDVAKLEKQSEKRATEKANKEAEEAEESQRFLKWEGSVIDGLKEKLGIDHGDATGLLQSKESSLKKMYESDLFSADDAVNALIKTEENKNNNAIYESLSDGDKKALNKKTKGSFWVGETFKTIAEKVAVSLDVRVIKVDGGINANKIFEKPPNGYAITDGRRKNKVPSAVARYVSLLRGDSINEDKDLEERRENYNAKYLEWVKEIVSGLMEKNEVTEKTAKEWIESRSVYVKEVFEVQLPIDKAIENISTEMEADYDFEPSDGGETADVDLSPINIPIKQYRIDPSAKNSIKIRPLVGKKFSEKEVSETISLLKENDFSVRTEKNFINVIGSHLNSDSNNIDRIQESSFKSKAQLKQEESKRKADERRDKVETSQEEDMTTKAGIFVEGVLGSSANLFNKSALARYISGTDKEFSGLAGVSWIKPLSEFFNVSTNDLQSYVSERGGTIDAIKSAFENEKNNQPDNEEEFTFAEDLNDIISGSRDAEGSEALLQDIESIVEAATERQEVDALDSLITAAVKKYVELDEIENKA